MAGSYCEETLANGESRVVLKLPAALAPIKLAVLPLVKKDGLPEKAGGDYKYVAFRLPLPIRREGFYW